LISIDTIDIPPMTVLRSHLLAFIFTSRSMLYRRGLMVEYEVCAKRRRSG